MNLEDKNNSKENSNYENTGFNIGDKDSNSDVETFKDTELSDEEELFEDDYLDYQDDDLDNETDDLDNEADDLIENIDDGEILEQGEDGRSLKQRVENLKDNIDQTKENIKNAKDKIENLPEEINKNKEAIKQKAEKAKENIKNIPDRAKNAKETIKNFPKNKEQILNNAKEKIKQGASNLKDNAIQGGKNHLKNKIENSKPVQAVKKAQRTYDDSKKAVETTKKAAQATAKATKKAAQATAKATKTVANAASKAAKGLIDLIVETFPYSVIVIAIVLLIVLIIVLAIALAPGKDNVNFPDEYDQYSEADTKTLGKLKDIYDDYPNADAALCMLAIVYPYYNGLQSGEVTYYLNMENEGWDPSKTYKDYEDDEELSSEDSCEGDGCDEDKEDCEGGSCEAEVGDDIYLELFRKWSYRRKFKKLLKKSNSMSEDEFLKYLKEDYIPKEKGYKGLLNFVKEDKKDKFIEAVIEDLKEQKSRFTNYIYETESCSSTSAQLGYVYDLEAIQGEVAIVLKDTTSTKFDTIKAAKSLYGTDDLHLNLKRYTLGVIYNEVGEYVKYEQLAKAEMIAVKSFVLGRTAPGSSETMGMGFKSEKINGKTVFYLRGNTYDQGFCDVYEGCQSGSKYDKNLVVNDPNGETHGNRKPPLSATAIANLEKWYDETAGEFVYDDKNKVFNGAQYNDFNSRCIKGRCLSQEKSISAAKAGSDYKTILFGDNYSESRFTLYNSETKSVASISKSCSTLSSNCGIDDNAFIYYSQKVGEYSDIVFCNRSDGTPIKKAGCGVTSMAMVIANLSDPKITPSITNQEAYQGGYCGASGGTHPDYFTVAAKKYNLTIKSKTKSNNTDIEKSANEIVNTIRNGGLVIINVNPSWLNHSSSGHYLVAKGLDKNGNLIIADPYADSLTTPVRNNVSAEEVIKNYVNNDHGWYMFTSDKSKNISEKYCANESEVILGGNPNKGYLGNPLKPADTKRDFMKVASARCFPRYCGGGAHSGFDLNSGSGAPYGAKVYAMDSGTVSFAGNYSGNCRQTGCKSGGAEGLGVSINHGNGYETGYWHFSKRVVNKGDKVEKGQLIGYVGNTGNSTGPHLHITLKNYSLYSKNGWYGARGHSDRGFMNAAKYINKNVSYVGKTQ